MDLFGDPLEPPEAPKPARRARPGGAVAAAPAAPDHVVLARRCGPQVHLGTSSWNFPGWNGLVWDGDYPETRLSREGLKAYAQHPLLRTVSVDRSFYRPMTASQFAALAAQVPPDFRFVVKAPALVTDAVVRTEDGRGRQPNPAFLSPELAISEFVQPALDGLGDRIGALVFQISPLPASLLADMPGVLQRLQRMLTALPRLQPVAPDGVIAVEVRNPQWLGPAFADVLKSSGATYCLGLHARMPDAQGQLPMLRALWPGPLVCRWSLNSRHGAQGYEAAKAEYAPFDRMVDPDPATRATLARVIRATAEAGFKAYMTINNKAEGSAPRSVLALAEALDTAGAKPAAQPAVTPPAA